MLENCSGFQAYLGAWVRVRIPLESRAPSVPSPSAGGQSRPLPPACALTGAHAQLRLVRNLCPLPLAARVSPLPSPRPRLCARRFCSALELSLSAPGRSKQDRGPGSASSVLVAGRAVRSASAKAFAVAKNPFGWFQRTRNVSKGQRAGRALRKRATADGGRGAGGGSRTPPPTQPRGAVTAIAEQEGL